MSLSLNAGMRLKIYLKNQPACKVWILNFRKPQTSLRVKYALLNV